MLGGISSVIQKLQGKDSPSSKSSGVASASGDPKVTPDQMPLQKGAEMEDAINKQGSGNFYQKMTKPEPEEEETENEFA